MPLRDHFRPPISRQSSWEGFLGGFPMVIVQHLEPLLPPHCQAMPRVHLGTYFEIDVATFDDTTFSDESREPEAIAAPDLGTKPQPWPEAKLTAEAELPDFYEYEVLIFDIQRARQPVAAIEIVSPANKDRPEARDAFITKCSSLVAKGVCVSIIDFFTIRNFNLYLAMLNLSGLSDSSFSDPLSPIYVSTTRQLLHSTKLRLESWACPLEISQPLPELPIWLDERSRIMFNLELAYEDACRALRIP